MLELVLAYSALAVQAAGCYLSGRRSGEASKSQSNSSIVRLAFSFFSVGMGGWILSVPAEIGASFGWFGAFGYAIVCTSPLWILMTIGYRLKVDESCLMTWIQARYGGVARGVVTICSLFYMSIFLASEFTIVGSLFEPFTHRLYGIAPVAVFALGHTAFRSSSNLHSHGLQGFLCLALVLAIVPAILAMIDVDDSKLPAASQLTFSGFFSVGILCIACSTSELLNFAEWQRVWSCENETVLTKALLLAASLIFVTLAGLGSVGVLASVASKELDDPKNAFSFGLEFSGRSIRLLVMLMGLVLATSTSDALAFGISELVRNSHSSVRESKVFLLLVVGLCVVVPCVLVAIKNISILSLFMIANLMTSIIAPPVFCGAVLEVNKVGLGLGLSTAVSVVTAFFLAVPELKDDLYTKMGLFLYASTVFSGGAVAVLASKICK